LTITDRLAAGPFTPRNERAVTLHELWHRYMYESGNLHGRTSTCWMMALSAATPMHCTHIAPDEIYFISARPALSIIAAIAAGPV